MALRKGPSGPFENVGGGAAYPNVLYVVKGTAVDPGEQDGSSDAPFSTITAALAAQPVALASGLTLLIAPGDYSGEAALGLANAGSYAFFNVAGHAFYPSDQHTIGNLDTFVLLPPVGLAGGAAFANINLQGCALGALDLGPVSTVQLFACAFSGTWTLGALNAADSLCDPGTVVDCATYCQFDRCELDDLAVDVAGAATVDFLNCVLETSLVVTFTGAAGVVNVDSRSNYFFNLLPGSIVNGTKTVQSDSGATPVPEFPVGYVITQTNANPNPATYLGYGTWEHLPDVVGTSKGPAIVSENNGGSGPDAGDVGSLVAGVVTVEYSAVAAGGNEVPWVALVFYIRTA